MNLQESIRRILREELKPNIISLLRRGDEINRVAKTILDNIYETDSNPNRVCKYGIDRMWKDTYISVATYFKNKYFTDIMTASNEWGRICVFIEKYMEENGFKDQLIKIYNKKCTKIQESTRIVNEEMTLQENIGRILDEEVNRLNFFIRRIKLDEVKKRLPINAEMIYYDTETYEDFKYFLTLTAVEEIMWNDYKIHWQDLPQKEEIEFVTELSNKFEKTIRRLYNIYQNK